MPPVPPIHRLLGTRGTVGNKTYCGASRNGRNRAYVRAKRRSNLAKYRTAASCAPIRENGDEFARASRLGQALRAALCPQLPTFALNKVSSRLTGTLRRLMALDEHRPRGRRRLLAAHLPGLVGFSFSPAASQALHLSSGGTVARTLANGLTLSLPPLPPAPARGIPAGATHYGYCLGLALLTEATGAIVPLAPAALPAPRALNPRAESPVTEPFRLFVPVPALPAGPAAVIVVLGLSYFEQRAGQWVPLLAAAAPVAVAGISSVAAARSRSGPPRRSAPTRCFAHRNRSWHRYPPAASPNPLVASRQWARSLRDAAPLPITIPVSIANKAPPFPLSGSRLLPH